MAFELRVNAFCEVVAQPIMSGPVQDEMDRRARLTEEEDGDLWNGNSTQPDIDDAVFPIEEEED